MICDSRRGFEFSRLNSLLSRAFSRQDKKLNINGIIIGSMTLKQYESYHDTLSTELLTEFFFFELILFILFAIDPTNFKKSYL